MVHFQGPCTHFRRGGNPCMVYLPTFTRINLPETNSSYLKSDGWKSTFMLERPIFSFSWELTPFPFFSFDKICTCFVHCLERRTRIGQTDRSYSYTRPMAQEFIQYWCFLTEKTGRAGSRWCSQTLLAISVCIRCAEPAVENKAACGYWTVFAVSTASFDLRTSSVSFREGFSRRKIDMEPGNTWRIIPVSK